MKTLPILFLAFLPCGLTAAETISPMFPESAVNLSALSLAETLKKGTKDLLGEKIKGQPYRDTLPGFFILQPRDKMPVLVPPNDIDPRMPILKPDPSVDYKLIVKSPSR